MAFVEGETRIKNIYFDFWVILASICKENNANYCTIYFFR